MSLLCVLYEHLFLAAMIGSIASGLYKFKVFLIYIKNNAQVGTKKNL